MQLVKLFGRKSRFCNGNALLGEAIVKRAAVSDRDYITDLVPEKVGIEGVG